MEKYKIRKNYTETITSSLDRRLPSGTLKPKSLLVTVEQYQGDKALCNARYQNKWYPILLNKKSLDDCGLEEDDTFEWIPRPDGIVVERDIIAHPRRLSPEDVQKARQTFERLRGEWNPETR